MRISLIVAILATSVPNVALSQAAALSGCSADGAFDTDRAVQALQAMIDVLVRDFEIDAGLPRQDTRARRRMRRNDTRIRIRCHPSTDKGCRDRSGWNKGLTHNTLHICYDKMASAGGDAFCRLVGLVVHEFGHRVRLPQSRYHDTRDGIMDTVYQYGWFARDLCKQAGWDRPLNGVNSVTSELVVSPPTLAAGGLAIYPKKHFGGHPRTLVPGEDITDLRTIGRNDAISSLRVSAPGRWELCEDRNYKGWCHQFDVDSNNLAAFEFNDKASSIREAAVPSAGITVYRRPGRTGGSRTFTGPVANLKAEGINDAIRSLVVHSGSWEVCNKSGFGEGRGNRGKCRVVSGTLDSLKPLKMHANISSLRPAGP